MVVRSREAIGRCAARGEVVVALRAPDKKIDDDARTTEPLGAWVRARSGGIGRDGRHGELLGLSLTESK